MIRKALMPFLFIVSMTSSATYAVTGDTEEYYIPELQPYSGEVKRFFENNTTLSVRGTDVRLFAPKMLEALYAQREYEPLWRSRVNALRLVKSIQNATYRGLRAKNSTYHLNDIIALLGDNRQGSGALGGISRSARIELLLSDAFLAITSHLHFGVVRARDMNLTAAIEKGYDAEKLLASAAVSGDFEALFDTLEPRHTEYHRLKRALADLLSIERNGGWERVQAPSHGEGNETLLLSESMRRLLVVGGDMDANATEDNATVPIEAVMAFQQRFGLTVDGIVGKNTLGAMNIPVESLISTVAANMERWRWAKTEKREDFLVVNIPDFMLGVFEKGEETLSMKVVVGRDQRQTPTFDSEVVYMVFNPYWRLPKTILIEDVLPKVKVDPSYFKRKHIRLFYAEDKEEKNPIDPAGIEWSTMDEQSIFAFRYREDPGPSNPLGLVKFLFPNSHDVYIHDTPATDGFRHDKSMFSSGCIRIQKPIELAALLLRRDYPNMTFKEIYEMLASGRTMQVWLKKRMQVWITYQTAWADDDGRIQFREDVYGRDEKLREAMEHGFDAAEVWKRVNVK